jgi:hypothetical protein
MAYAPIGDPGQESGDRHPEKLVPVKEGESQKRGLSEIIKWHPKEPDIRNDEQPKGRSRSILHLISPFTRRIEIAIPDRRGAAWMMMSDDWSTLRFSVIDKARL